MGPRPSSCLLLLLLVLLVPAALEVAAQCSNEDPCEGQPNCDGCTVGDFVPNPEDCRGYYRCTGSTADGYFETPLTCPDGEVFNATSRQCEEGDTCDECPVSRDCVYECPVPTTTAPPPFDAYSVVTNNKVPSFDDCSTYYICVNGEPTLSVTCDAEKPFFDGNKCQADESLCCHCHAYCDEATAAAFGQVPDPLDCRRYYICFEEGNPTDSVKCPDGEYYDTTLMKCSATASCETQCENVVGEDGCINPFTCLSAGYFARCPSQCTADYYRCSAATGEYQEHESCASGLVFHPTSHTCVSPDKCP